MEGEYDKRKRNWRSRFCVEMNSSLEVWNSSRRLESEAGSALLEALSERCLSVGSVTTPIRVNGPLQVGATRRGGREAVPRPVMVEVQY